MAETVTSNQYFKRRPATSYRQAATPNPPMPSSLAVDGAPSQAAPREHNPADTVSRDRAQAPAKSWRLSGYECAALVLTVLMMLGLIFGNLMMQSKTQSIVRSSQELAQQTMELRKQTDLMRDQMTEQYNYETIKQAAEKQGMQVRQDSVKDLTKP